MTDSSTNAAELALERALSQAAEAHLRYLARAHAADLEGYPEVGSQFRALAKGYVTAGTKHLDLLHRLRGGHAGARMGDTEAHVAAAIEDERKTAQDLGAGLAAAVENAGETDLAVWFRECAAAAEAAASALEARQGKLG